MWAKEGCDYPISENHGLREKTQGELGRDAGTKVLK
jgi:hypothetical protein